MVDATPAELLGAAFESLLSAGERRARGTHYTPAAIAREVVAHALGEGPIDPDDPPCVLDPAMGAGVFLEAALEALVARAGRPDTPALRRALAVRALFGIDRDPRAARLARWTLALAVGDAEPTAHGAELVLADALLDGTVGPARGKPWGRAFPRVFDRPRPGFDLIVGNPPFLGGKRIRTVHGDAYADALSRAHTGVSKNTDLAAHFVRRAYAHLRPGGALGFVVTNSIAQGDTREAGLAQVVRSGGTIFRAETRRVWPGLATVVTSLVWIRRGPSAGGAVLDGKAIAEIDPWLTAHGRSDEPTRLASMKGRGFIGCFLRGAGFVFDDRDPRATPLAEARRILEARPESREVLRPFLGGEEIVTDPEHRPHRMVAAFGARSLDQARAFPELLAVVEAKVRPFRDARRATPADARHRERWWRFANDRPELFRAIEGLERVIVIPRVAAHLVAVMVPTGPVFSDQVVVVASASPGVLAVLSSEVHAVWARLHASTLGDGLRYGPSDVLETFPFPLGGFDACATSTRLCEVGARLHEVRAKALSGRRVGLTTLMRDVLDPACREEGALAVRAALADLDRAVLGAYGFDDLELVREPDARGKLRPTEAWRDRVLERLFALGAPAARVSE